MLLAALTVLAAIPVGLVLAWVLLAVINVEAFGWRLPMYLFPLDWLRLAALSLAGRGAGRALARSQAGDDAARRLLKVFANER